MEGQSQQSMAPIVYWRSDELIDYTETPRTPHRTLPTPADRTHKCSFKNSLLTLQTTVLQPHTQLAEEKSGPETREAQRFL